MTSLYSAGVALGSPGLPITPTRFLTSKQHQMQDVRPRKKKVCVLGFSLDGRSRDHTLRKTSTGESIFPPRLPFLHLVHLRTLSCKLSPMPQHAPNQFREHLVDIHVVLRRSLEEFAVQSVCQLLALCDADEKRCSEVREE